MNPAVMRRELEQFLQQFFGKSSDFLVYRLSFVNNLKFCVVRDALKSKRLKQSSLWNASRLVLFFIFNRVNDYVSYRSSVSHDIH